MNHTHNHCEHNNLKYCKICDVVYCDNCGKEWGKSQGYYIYTDNDFPYYPNYPASTTGLSFTDGSHFHKEVK